MPHAESLHETSPPTINGVHLHVNDDLLSPDEVELLVQSRPTDDLDVLREQYRQNGYLLVKGLIPREDVLSARESYFQSLAPSGVMKPGTSPRDGIFDDAKSPADYPGIGAGSIKNAAPGETDQSAVFTSAALRAHTEAWYAGSDDGTTRGFCNHPALAAFVARLTGWGADNTLAVKRTLLRNNTPGNRAIGVHYDQSFMRYGEPTSVTASVPMGDVRLEGGGLIYLRDGERLGERIEDEFAAKARAAGMSDEETRNAFNANMMATGFLSEGPADFGRTYGKRWMVSAYEAGDVVFHSAHMIHASTKNYDPEGRIRLGTDLRFVDKRRPWDTRWDKHYSFNDGV